MSKKKPFKITICWGGIITDERPISTYEFSTKEELDAFVLGTQEAEGWENWKTMTEDDYVDCHRCGAEIPEHEAHLDKAEDRYVGKCCWGQKPGETE